MDIYQQVYRNFRLAIAVGPIIEYMFLFFVDIIYNLQNSIRIIIIEIQSDNQDEVKN